MEGTFKMKEKAFFIIFQGISVATRFFIKALTKVSLKKHK